MLDSDTGELEEKTLEHQGESVSGVLLRLVVGRGFPNIYRDPAVSVRQFAKHTFPIIRLHVHRA
jgi:hypothetical protein